MVPGMTVLDVLDPTRRDRGSGPSSPPDPDDPAGCGPRARLGPIRLAEPARVVDHPDHRRRRRGVRIRPAAAVQPVLDVDARRRGHGRPRVVAGLPPRSPPDALPHHRLDTRLVRRVSCAALLLPAADAADRRRQRGAPLHGGLQARVSGRAGPAAGCCVGLRKIGQDAVPGAGVPGGRHLAVPVLPGVHHLRRQHRLDAGRGVRLLHQPRRRAGLSRAGGPWDGYGKVPGPGGHRPHGDGTLSPAPHPVRGDGSVGLHAHR